jgi:DNA polymerase-3 subunit epsilon
MFQPSSTIVTGSAAPPAVADNPHLGPDFVVIDVETACSRVSSICQIGIVGFRDGMVDFEYETLVDPRDQFSSFNTRIHGITEEHVVGQPCFGDVHGVVHGYLTGRTTVAHSYFDKGALAAACRVHGRAGIETIWLDSARVAKRAWPALASHKLNVVARHLGIPLKHHDALSDARAAGMIVVRAIEHSGITLAQWLAPTPRQRVGPAPTPAAEGPLRGERIAILGQPRSGPLAHCIAASGGRVVSAVGSTTTILVVIGDEPFGYARDDAQFRKAVAMQRSGGSIQILSERQMAERLA